MAKKFEKNWKLSLKLFSIIGIICVAPVITLLAISLGHLRKIQDITVEDTRESIIASETEQLRQILKGESSRLSAVFSRIQDETYFIGAEAKNILTQPVAARYRNGSRYRLDNNGIYRSLGNDGNSTLFVPRYSPSLDPIISATESLDILLKPLAQRESRMVLGWIITRNEVLRCYPWSDFRRFPKEKVLTSWPFYYLADASHNPTKGTVFTPVYNDPLSKEWMISCLCPVYVHGRHEATVGMDITIHNILEEINVRFTKKSSAILFSGSEIIAASDNLPLAALGLKSSIPSHGQDISKSSVEKIRTLATVIRYLDHSVQFIETPDLRAYVGFATIEPLGWKIVFLVPEEEFLGPVGESALKILTEMKEIRINYVNILVFSLLSVVIITISIVMIQSRGLRSLLNGIREFGNGNLSHRMPEEQTEMGQLAKALNSMAQKLQDKKNQLQQVFAEVEQGRKLAAVGRLAAGVAHEVNNPLATISTYVQMVIRQNDLPNDVSDNMKTVMVEIQRIQSQLRNLLDLSRIESPSKADVNPNSIVREIADLVRYETTTRGVNLVLDLCQDGQAIIADSSGVKQVIWNLVRNALDVLNAGGTICVRTFYTAKDEELSIYAIEVQDDGPGIPDSQLPLIFEPFFTTKDVGHGTGLGLSIVYNIVKNHDGTIEVCNLSPKGCLFTVAFPIKRRD